MLIGFATSLQVIFALDVLSVGRMRLRLFQEITHSEVPNMRMVHWKEDSSWVDALMPKFIGYSSGLIHKLIAFISALWAFSIPFVPLAICVFTQYVCYQSIQVSQAEIFSQLLSFSGLFFSGCSIFVFAFTLFVPLPFRFQHFERPNLNEDALQSPPSTGETAHGGRAL